MTLPAWCADYIGLPYVWGARGPAAYDCWGLIAHVLQQRFAVAARRIQTPGREDDFPAMAALANAAAADFQRMFGRDHWRAPLIWPEPAERPGDIILMRRACFACHVGIVVAPDWMIHGQAGIGVAAASLRNGIETRNILAVYRHPDLM